MVLNYERELFDLLTEVVSASLKLRPGDNGYADLLKLRLEILSEIQYAIVKDNGKVKVNGCDCSGTGTYIYNGPVKSEPPSKPEKFNSPADIHLDNGDLDSKDLQYLLGVLFGNTTQDK